MNVIQYEDFSKLELRVGQVQLAEQVEGSEKLVKITVNVGENSARTLVADIGKVYPAEELY